MTTGKKTVGQGMSYDNQFLDCHCVDFVDGFCRRWSNELLEIGPIDERQIDGRRQIRCGEDQNVRICSQLIELGKYGVDHTQRVARLVSCNQIINIITLEIGNRSINYHECSLLMHIPETVSRAYAIDSTSSIKMTTND